MTDTAARRPPDDMSLRLELFVDDLAASIAFYVGALGFREEQRQDDYASVRNGAVVFGLGLASQLPLTHHFGPLALRRQRGVGIEIVLEVADVDAAYRVAEASRYAVASPPTDRPWGLRDFRIIDPDGYYLRVTSRPA